MGLHDYLVALRRHPLVVLVAAAAVLLPAAHVVLRVPDVWSARATVVLEVAARDTPRELVDGADLARSVAPGVARLAATPAVLARAGRALDPPVGTTEMQASTDVRGEVGSAVLTVVASAPSPAAAMSRADAVASQVVEQTGGVTPRGDEDDLQVTARLLQSAQPPSGPSGPDRRLALGLAVLGAPLAGVVAAAVVDTPARRRRRPPAEELPDVLLESRGVPRRPRRGRTLAGVRRRTRGAAGGERGHGGMEPVLREVTAGRAVAGGGVLAVTAPGSVARATSASSRSRGRGAGSTGGPDAVVAGLVTALGADGSTVLVVDGAAAGVERPASGPPARATSVGGAPRTTLDALLADGTGGHGAPPGADATSDVDPLAVQAALTAARRHYDVVVLLSPGPGTPRGLAVAGSASDVLLVVGRDPAARGELAEAARLLGPAGPRVHGVVVG